MVGLREYLFGKSKSEVLHELILSDRQCQKEINEKNHSLMVELVKSVSQQSNTFSDFLKMTTSINKPEVRVMDDADEARFEQLRKLKQSKLSGNQDSPLHQPTEVDLLNIFDELRTGLV